MLSCEPVFTVTLATPTAVRIRCGFWKILKIWQGTYNQSSSDHETSLKYDFKWLCFFLLQNNICSFLKQYICSYLATRYNIMWWRLSVTCDRSVVLDWLYFKGYHIYSQKNKRLILRFKPALILKPGFDHWWNRF
jgi:hypothetical protein